MHMLLKVIPAVSYLRLKMIQKLPESSAKNDNRLKHKKAQR